MSSTKISIPQPCSYGWDKMTIVNENNGRHCNSCNKIVVDFTLMNDQELKDFFTAHQGQRICGHFKTIQIESPINNFSKAILRLQNYIELNFRKNILRSTSLLFVGLLLTLTGCPNHTEGELIDPHCRKDSSIVNFNGDTVKAVGDSIIIKKH